MLGTAKPIPDIGAGGPDNGCVDPDQLSLEIDQRAAGITRIDGCIGLYEILITLDIKPAPSQRAYDSRGDGLSQAKWIADRNDEISYVKQIGIAEA